MQLLARAARILSFESTMKDAVQLEDASLFSAAAVSSVHPHVCDTHTYAQELEDELEMPKSL